MLTANSSQCKTMLCCVNVWKEKKSKHFVDISFKTVLKIYILWLEFHNVISPRGNKVFYLYPQMNRITNSGKQKKLCFCYQMIEGPQGIFDRLHFSWRKTQFSEQYYSINIKVTLQNHELFLIDFGNTQCVFWHENFYKCL